jgi:hypothetical protein
VTGAEKKEKEFKMPAPWNRFYLGCQIPHGFETNYQNKLKGGKIVMKSLFTTLLLIPF